MIKSIMRIFNPIKPNEQSFNTLISEHDIFEGNITFSGCLHNHGTIKNNQVKSSEKDKNSTLIVTKTGSIECDSIIVPHIIIEGKITAEVLKAEQTVVIKKTANIVISKISTRNISIENGAIINCGCISNTEFENTLDLTD